MVLPKKENEKEGRNIADISLLKPAHPSRERKEDKNNHFYYRPINLVHDITRLKIMRNECSLFSESGKFRSSKLGLLFFLFQFLLQLWTSYIVIKYLLESAAMRPQAICSKGNYCSVFCIVLSHTVIALLLIIVLPFRFKLTLSLFNEANYILHRQSAPTSFIYYSMLPFSVAVVIKMIISATGFHIGNPELFYPYHLAYFGPLIIIHIIGALCSISERAFQSINEELKQLTDFKLSQTYRKDRISVLMQQHWQVTDFLEHISKCFSTELLLVMIDIYVQLILFLYVTLWSMFAQKIFSGMIWPHVSGLLEVVIIACKLTYLCYRCERAVKEGNATIFYVRQVSSVMPYDSDAQQLLKFFSMKICCRDVAITAHDFFTVNLSLLVRIVGVVLTYFLVLIQFQVDGETALQGTPLSTAPKSKCKEWPCIKPV